MVGLAATPEQLILQAARAQFNTRLTTPCTILRDEPLLSGASSGGLGWVRETVCSLNESGTGGDVTQNSVVRQRVVGVPGGRTLSFAWDEDVRTDDFVVLLVGLDPLDPESGIPLTTPRYELSIVNKDDPLRLGLVVGAELQRAPDY